MADKWYFAQAGLEFGPYSPARMMELAADGTLRRSAAVWKEGMTRRVAASKVDKLFPPAQPPSREADAPAIRSSPPDARVTGDLSPTSPGPPDAATPPVAGPADLSPAVTADPAHGRTAAPLSVRTGRPPGSNRSGKNESWA